jgi:TIR domain
LYNLLVTGHSDAWDSGGYEFDRERFGEHSSPRVMEKFRSLDPAAIEELKSLPTLFAYEGDKENVRVGYIRRIKERQRSIYIEYEFETAISEIPFSKIAPLRKKLDIYAPERGLGEMNRTHWAVKDEDLFEILFEAGLVDQTFLSSVGQLGRIEDLKFKVALSFPGERREYVSEVAAALKRRLRRGLVFYDRDFTSHLARPNLDTLLQKIYRHNSELVVIFLSKEYEKKDWCGLEWRAIREIIMDRENNTHSIMFMRFYDTPVEGVFKHDGYIDLNAHSPSEAANFILQRVESNSRERFEPPLRRDIRPPWPEEMGAYVAASSETIPNFPEVLSGYRSENNKDFWGNAFDCRGTIRVFDGNGWEGIWGFPNTMNGCSAGVFMIRWRSSSPDIPVSTIVGYAPDTAYGEAKTGSFGYMYGTNCEQPLFKVAGASLVDVYYELKFWRAAP